MKKGFVFLISCWLIVLAWSWQSCTKEELLPTICTPGFRPVVMVHGFLASGDTYAKQFQRFHTNGYCWSHLRAFDWNTTGFGADNSAALDALINEVLTTTGATQVDLVGHSAGGGTCYTYLSDPVRAAKVAHYVHVGSSAQNAPAGPANAPVPTLNIGSPADLVSGTSTIPGALNLSLPNLDHYQVATGTLTFLAMYGFFNNNTAPLTAFISDDNEEIEIAGKALTLGENQAINGGTVKIYPVDPATGFRLSNTPLHQLTTNSNGTWGPVVVPKSQPLELEVRGTGASDRTIHYYREGFTHSDHLVYLRVLPPPFSLAGILLGSLPSNDTQTVMAVFSANQAIIAERDDFSVNGIDLATEDFAPADKTAIAFFLYDDGDSTTELNPVGTFGNFPFLNGIDFFMPTTPEGSITLQYNGRTMHVKNWRSATDGLIVPVFD